MELKTLNYFFESFAEEKMNFLYSGVFNDELTDCLIDLNNSQSKKGDEVNKSHRKAAFLIAECFQNIVRHSDILNENSYFHIKNNKGLFNIISGNTILKEMMPTLKIQIEQLNKLTTDELRVIYRKTLAEGKLSNKGGAGLGLIEMARKTKNKLSFSFSEINEILAYFYFQLQLKEPNLDKGIYKSNFKKNISYRDTMVNADLFLVYKGEISAQITSSILKIIDTTFKLKNHKSVFLKLMSIYEKVSSINSETIEKSSNMLIIGDNSTKYNMATVCLLDNRNAAIWNNVVEYYQSLNDEELQLEYLKLKKAEHCAKIEFKLSLIELLIKSDQFIFTIRPYSNELIVATIRLGLLKIINKEGDSIEVDKPQECHLPD